MAEAMENRMAAVTSDLSRRIDGLRALPVPGDGGSTWPSSLPETR